MIRDPAWILDAPQLMTAPEGIASLSWLNHTFQPDVTGIDPTRCYHKRLGIYYENLVNEILNSSTQPVEIYRNIKVYKEKITLGEFDFIGTVGGQKFHLECAIKFYLRVGDGSQLSDFIGPGKKDRLDIKWRRMLEHQLPLSATEEGINSCQQYAINPQLRALLLQGYLFHPFREWQASLPDLHPEINPDHLRGWWLKLSDLDHLQPAVGYTIMQKPDWLVVDNSSILSFTDLAERLQDCRNPQLVARLDGDGVERDRGFVVADNW